MQLIEPALKISDEYNFAFTKAMGTILSGWALAQLGNREDGIARMQQGLEVFKVTDAVHMTPYFSSLLAEAYGDAGRADEGLELFEGLDPAQNNFGSPSFTGPRVSYSFGKQVRTKPGIMPKQTQRSVSGKRSRSPNVKKQKSSSCARR